MPRQAALNTLNALALSLAAAAMAWPSCAQTQTQPPTPTVAALPELLGVPARLPLVEAGAAPADAAPGAAAPPGPPLLSLRGAALLTLAQSPDVRAARYRAESFFHNQRAARGALLPRLDLRHAQGRGEQGSIDPAPQNERVDAQATLRQALFDAPAYTEWRRQGQLIQAAELQLDSAGSEALLEAAGAYVAVLQSGLALQLGADYQALLDELLRYVSERAAAGGTSNADRDRVRARVANVRGSLSDSRAALDVALRQVERLTGLTPAQLDLMDAVPLELPADVQAASSQASAVNPALRASRVEADAVQEERRAIRRRDWPRVELEVSHASNRNSAGTIGQQYDTKVMVVVSVSLLNGGTDHAQASAAAARGMELQARTERVERRLRQELDSAYSNLAAGRARFQSVRDELDNNRRVVEAFRAQMVGGTRPLLDMLDAYQRLHQSRLDLVQVVASVTLAEWRVAHLSGSLRGALGLAGPLR